MRRFLFLLLCVFGIMILPSCSIIKNNINTEQTYLKVKIFQTLSKTSALASTSAWDYKVVKVITNEELYYDGKNLTGTFVLVDTYAYETKNGDIKTVPVYMRKSEMR